MNLMKKIVHTILGIPNRIYNALRFSRYHITHGKNFSVSGRIFAVSNTRDGIRIGDDVRINSCRAANPIGGDSKTILFAKGDGKIRIGNGCGISNATLFACENITVGNNVLLGNGVKIYDTDFHWLQFEKRMSEPGGAVRPVTVKDGAFIGAFSIILKGVTIGEKSVVGAGSVVTKSIPDGEIWAGNPARFIRKVEEDGGC